MSKCSMLFNENKDGLVVREFIQPFYQMFTWSTTTHRSFFTSNVMEAPTQTIISPRLLDK